MIQQETKMAKQARYVIRYWPLNSKGKTTSHTVQMVELNSQAAVASWDSYLQRQGHRVVGIEDRWLQSAS
jgi:hypothetical protein